MVFSLLKKKLLMLNESFIHPKRIVVVGGSDNLKKPGGKVLYNLKDGRFKGEILVVNPKKHRIQGCATFAEPGEIKKEVDLAILAVPAKFCLESIMRLFDTCKTQSYIIISAGFGETDENGAELEAKIKEYALKHSLQIFGPNCTGIITPGYSGTFTTPVPEYKAWGVDLISSSGATAVFLMEQGILQGMRFKNVFSVGNGLMISVEDVLEFLDSVYSHKTNKVIILYLETIRHPDKLFKHAISLFHKGCRLVALKAGKTEAGNKAATSHTGALSNSYDAVEALFRKAKILSCNSRNELINAALVCRQQELKGKSIAVVTHAGGPGVMATDALEKGGFGLHSPCDTVSISLKEHLPVGSSVGNPFDILATGGVKELSYILNYVQESKCYNGVVVIFGSPGLFNEQEVFDLLSDEINASDLPIFLVVPSPINAKSEIENFIRSDNFYFTDETCLAEALEKSVKTLEYPDSMYKIFSSKFSNNNNLLPQNITNGWLSSVDFQLVDELHTDNSEDLLSFFKENKPVVLKASELTHKTEAGGVKLNISTESQLRRAVQDLTLINGSSFTVQKQVSGFEIYLGVKYDKVFGHLIYFGKGGTLLEVEKDIEKALFPLNFDEVMYLLEKLKYARVWKGFRNQKGVDLERLTREILKLNDFIDCHPEIKELDINPIICTENQCVIVDARIVV